MIVILRDHFDEIQSICTAFERVFGETAVKRFHTPRGLLSMLVDQHTQGAVLMVLPGSTMRTDGLYVDDAKSVRSGESAATILIKRVRAVLPTLPVIVLVDSFDVHNDASTPFLDALNALKNVSVLRLSTINEIDVLNAAFNLGVRIPGGQVKV
jgi:hypothetical protein